MDSLHYLAAHEAADLLARREVSSVELTRSAFDRVRALDDSLNAFLTLTEEEALAQAEAADKRIARGEAGPLTGIPAAIVTNGGSAMQSRKIDASGLRGLVDAVVISEELGVAKPDPRIFEHAMDRIGAVATDSLFVGDNSEADILGAKGVGMQAAWLRRGREWTHDGPRPDYILDDISVVRELVLPDGSR